MKKIFRHIILICLCLAMVLSEAATSFASETVLYGYYINVSDLDSNVQKYVSSIYLSNESSGWALYINNRYVGTKSGTVVTFDYSPNANTYYVFTFDTSSRRATSYYKNTKEETVVSVFTFSIVDAVQTVEFLSDPNAKPVTKTAKLDSSGYFDFGTYNFSYKNQQISFSLKVNSNTNKAIITRDGKEYPYVLNGTGKYETVYCENVVPAQEIHMNYMETALEKQNYSNAKSILYTPAQVDSALALAPSITLINNKTGLSTNVKLQRTITYWARREGSGTAIGDGTYDEYQTTVQVVCQWAEDKCSGIRSSYGESGRPFAVYGDSVQYPYVKKATANAQKIQYQNRVWTNDTWSSTGTYAEMLSGMDKTNGFYQYKKAPVTWSAWQDWEEYTGTKVRAYSNSENYQYETRTAYGYNSRAWGDWSDYIYSSCTESEDSIECKSALRYAKRTRSWGAWSGYIYTGTETLGCSDVATAVGATCDRESATRYAKQIGTYSAWSGYSSWSTAACTSSDTKSCESKTYYSYRSIGAWSSWEPTTLNVACSTKSTSAGGDKGLSLLTTDCKTETTYRKRTRSIDSYTYSSFGDYQTSKYDWTAGCKSRTGENTECGIKRYSYGGWGSSSTSKYGNYQEGCVSVYTSNSSCGLDHYNTTFGDYKDSKYGSYTSDCTSKTVNDTCKTYNTSGATCGYDFSSWSAYTDWSTTSCSSSDTKDCYSRTEYRSRTCSTYKTSGPTCGYNSWVKQSVTAVDSCTATTGTTYKYECSAKCILTTGDCVKGKYKRTYYTRTAKGCAAAGCSTWGSWSGYSTTSCTASAGSKECGTRTTYRYRTRTKTAKSCAAAGCSVYNKKTQYSCPTSKTAVYKSCYLYECPSTKTAVYNSCTSYSCPYYRTTNYSSWSAWSDWSSTSCTAGDLVDCDTKTTNYKRTRDWGSWSDYIYTTASTSSTTDNKSHLEYRYQTRTLTWGDYSDYIYTSCTENATTNCKSATRWRTRYLSDWSSWSGYNSESCTSSDTVDCKSQTMYARRVMGAWSSTIYGSNSSGIYTLTSCVDSSTRRCLSQQQIRAKTKSGVGTYGSWLSSDTYSYDSNYSYLFRWNNGTIETSNAKGYENANPAIGARKYVGQTSVKEKVDTAIQGWKTYSVSSRMTVSEISSLTTQIGNDAGEAYYVNQYISQSEDTDTSGNKYITWDYWEGHKAVYGMSGQAAANTFTNSKRFIPYFFISKHNRATNAKFYIKGYDNEAITNNTIVKTFEEETKGNLVMHPDEETFYDYCELYPNSDECYCQAHPNADRCRPVEPEPDYCEVHPDSDECFCRTYPESKRCKGTSVDTAVIYYNYLDPLENYSSSNMPSNWQGYEALVNEIKRSDLSGYKIQVTLTKSDLEQMRHWIDENPDKLGTCIMIREFSYIFTGKNSEITSWLLNGSGCKVNR